MILPYRPKVKAALMNAEEIAEHNRKVQVARVGVSALMPGRKQGAPLAWLSTGKRYEPDTSSRTALALDWNTAVVSALWSD